MENNNYPVPHSHKSFEFGNIVIDSNFDSGNLYNAEKVNPTNVPPTPSSTTSGSQSTTSKTSIALGSTFQ